MKFDRNIDIGSLEAEDDNFLIDSFVNKTDFKSLNDTTNQKSIILGRTGMGKSALIRKLVETKENISQIRPEEMSLKYLSNSDILKYFRSLDINLDLFYKVLWKHVFIVEILKLYYGEDKIKTGNKIQNLIETVDFRLNIKKRNAIEYLRKWHDKFWENTEYRIKEIEDKLKDSLKQSLGSDAKLFEEFIKAKIGAESEEVIEKSKKTEVINKAQSVVNNIQLSEISTILEIIKKDLLPNTQKKFFIVIDDLDKYWVDKSIVYDLILSLIVTIKEINNCSNIKIIISLRLNLLQLALQKANTTGFQREKFENMFLHLYWNENELKELLQNRVNNLYLLNRETPIDLLNILPKAAKRGGKLGGFEYMLNRSFYRPRDIISFFNKSIKYCEGSTKIPREAINLAENDFSLERLNAVEDEWRENYDVLRVYINVLKHKPKRFSLEDIDNRDIEKFCRNAFGKTRQKEIKNILFRGWHKGNLNKVRNHLINVLFKIGCIGVKESPEKKTTYSFHYNNTIDELNIESNYAFFINPAFYKTLSIKTKMSFHE